jgi:hypothetical protein
LLSDSLSIAAITALIKTAESNVSAAEVETIVAHARHNLSPFKVSTVIRLIAENDLPMLPTGKVDRQGLVRVLTAGSPVMVGSDLIGERA